MLNASGIIQITHGIPDYYYYRYSYQDGGNITIVDDEAGADEKKTHERGKSRPIANHTTHPRRQRNLFCISSSSLLLAGRVYILNMYITTIFILLKALLRLLATRAVLLPILLMTNRPMHCDQDRQTDRCY